MKDITQETLEILETGRYPVHGRTVDIAADLAASVERTRLYRPDDFTEPGEPRFDTSIEMTNETTLEAARRLGENVAALNFASAKNPGGGFIGGARAQEEDLARASGLYRTQLAATEFYEFHRAQRDLRYSDHMIYSPGVPVFRDDSGALLEEPYKVSFITSAAPNRGAIRDGLDVSEALKQRAWKVLSLALEQGHEELVLGAWGCGVFRNDPAEVARVFADLLAGPYEGRFRTVVFAVWDPNRTTRQYLAFSETFGRKDQ